MLGGYFQAQNVVSFPESVLRGIEKKQWAFNYNSMTLLKFKEKFSMNNYSLGYEEHILGNVLTREATIS